MKATDPLVISPSITLDAAKTPVVIIGANGSGKSMLGVDLATRGAVRIAARRALDIPSALAGQSLDQAERERKEMYQRFAHQRTIMASDLQVMLVELQAHDAEVGRSFREKYIQDGSTPDKATLVTRLDNVRRIWETIFPGRKLSFERSTPRVTGSHRGGQVYAQNEMSDGERQALYLAAKIAIGDDGAVFVVDEPEIHLHPSLARRLWDLLEEFRPNSRFVYITHDLLFAAGRTPCSYVACRASGNHEIVQKIPGDVTAEILGAVSMPLSTSRVIFCEGQSNSRDIGLFDIWFDPAQVSIFPVGGCDDVVNAIHGYAAMWPSGGGAAGIVDRDVRCDEELTYLATKAIHVLPVAEIEHLYCLPGVVRAVLKYLGRSAQEQDSGVEAIRAALIQHHTPAVHRLALQRAQDRVRWHLRFPLSTVSPGVDTATASANLASAFQSAVAAVDPAKFYAESERRIRTALGGTLDEMLRELKGKVVLGFAAQSAGLANPEAYTRIVRQGLRGELSDQFKQELIAAFQPHLPSR